MQLSLLRPPSLELTDRGRSVPGYWLGQYSLLLAHVRLMNCRGRVEGVCRRRRRTTDAAWSNRDVRRLLGIDRRQFAGLERWGLIAWEGNALVLPHYHRSSECRDEEDTHHLRRIGRVGGIKSGEARRRALETADSRPSDRGGDPTRIPGGIRSVILNVLADLARTGGSSALDAPPARGQIGDRGPSSPGPAPQMGPPSKNGPSAATPILKRIEAASTRTVAHRVLARRRPDPEESGARTGRSTCAPRGASSASHGDVKPAAAGRLSRRGGPEFPLVFTLWRRRTGKPFLKQKAAEVWTRLDMSPRERVAFVECLQQVTRVYGDEVKAPTLAAFLESVWEPELERVRSKRRRDDGVAGRDLVGAVMENLKRRQSR